MWGVDDALFPVSFKSFGVVCTIQLENATSFHPKNLCLDISKTVIFVSHCSS